MKKGLLFLALCILSTHLFAQEWVSCPQSAPVAPKVKLVSDTECATTLSFNLGGFFKKEVRTPQGMQCIITVPKMASMLEEGAPDLPLFAIPVLIDDGAKMEVRIDDYQYLDFENIEIAPSKGNINRQINPDEVPYRYGAAYSQNQFFPGFQANLDQPYILRDFRGQNILVYPFAYNPITKTLRVFTHLQLTMSRTNEKGNNQKLRRRSSLTRLSSETEAMYAHRFINYREKATKYAFVADEGELLVICPDRFLEAMQPFVDWKNKSGRQTTMVSLSDIGSNNPDLIKSCILNHYNNPDENLCYVLLVGDYADLTPKMMSGGASDIWFGQLEGSDYYPEVFVGRFSAESVTDVQNQVTKVVYYERDITSQADWLSKGIGIGSSEGAGSGHNGGESDYQHIEYIRDTLLHYTYSEVSQHYHGVGVGTNATMLRENFNSGASICNYCNHGAQTSWYVGNFNNSHINALTNDYKWPVIWSTACLNGQFNYSQPCFAETWMRATNNATGAPTGAIGGMFSWTSQPWQPPMTGQDEMVDILCEWNNADQYHHTLGGASLNGNMKILDLHPSDQGATHNTWILFGDPSMTMRTANPTEMHVTCEPEALFLGQTELRLTAETEYAFATLSVNGNVIASTPIVNGEAIMSFESPSETGTAQLVVTSFNKVTEVRDIAIIPANGAYLTYTNFNVNDSNGQADYGETTNINLTIKNIGNETASNIQVMLSTESPDIHILSGTATIPSIEPLGEYTIINAFLISVNEMITDGTQAYFTLLCTDGTHTWNSQFRMTLHAPTFSLSDFRPLGNTNPGESGTLIIGVRNTGSSDANAVKVQLYSSSTELVFNPIQHNVGMIPAGSSATATFTFTTSSDMPYGSSIEVYYHIEALTYTLNGTELINIGPVKETFETGDFSSFAWETLGGANWFIDNNTSNTGSYSARSGAIGNTHITTLQTSFDVSEDGIISFFKKVCTEANKDKLTFYIDNTPMGEWSGEVNWSRETFPVSAGTHKFKWIYMKDGNGSYGDDCCWIDDIQFPSSNMVTLLPELELEARVVENEVTLTWLGIDNVDHYIIRRDGVPVSTQLETSFTQLVNIGNYTYSVVAISTNGQQSIPAFATVEITVMGIDSIENTLKIFPNPTRNALNISFEAPYNYIIYNNIGQNVLSGHSTGDTLIDCGVLEKGIYVIHIAAEGQIIIKKIIVE